MTLPIPELATLFLLTFARVGTLVMLLPGLGERIVPGRIRLGLALFLALLILPISRGLIPQPGSPAALVGVLLGELAVGFVLGLSVRMVVAAMQVAGTVLAQQLGLSYATTIDPSVGGQDAAVANFLNLLAVALIFATDIHHLAIGAIRDSYALLPPVGVPDPGDAARLAVMAVGRGFALALKIAAPFVAFALLLNFGLGILSRLMPQIQVFFLGLPLTILVGMLVLLAALGLMMSLYLAELSAFLSELGRA